MSIKTKILKNKPKLNSNGQYKFNIEANSETNLGVSGDFNNKFTDDDLYTINLRNEINEEVLNNNYDLLQETEFKLTVKVRNSGVGGSVKSIRFKVSLFDEGIANFNTVDGLDTPFTLETYNPQTNQCVHKNRVINDDNSISYDEITEDCNSSDFYKHYKNIIQDNQYKIFDKSYDQQSNTWNPEPLINDDVILTNFYDENLPTEYNDDFSSDANQSFNIDILKLSEENYTSIGTDDSNNFYIVVYMQGHKDLLIGTDKRDSRIQVFKIRKRDLKFELDTDGNAAICFDTEQPSTNPNCFLNEEDGNYYQKRTSSYIFNQSYSDSIKYQGNEGGGIGAESPAFKCNEVKVETTSPYFIIDKSRVPDDFKSVIKFPISLGDDEYERFFELSPNNLVNFLRLPDNNLAMDFIVFSNITTLDNDLQQYYFDYDKIFKTSAPNFVTFNLSVQATDGTSINNDDLGFAFFVIDWNDNDKKYEDWESVLGVIPQTFSTTFVKQQQDNLFILRGISQGGNIGAFSEVGNLQHFYRTSGLKTIKSVVFSYAKDNNDRIQAIRWKLVTSRIFLNENRVTKEDFSELGTLGFTTIPWPYTTPIISGVSKLSKYYDSVENTLFNNKFADDELLSETKVYNTLVRDMDEMGDFIGDVDIEQTRFFSGTFDMDELLMIESDVYNPYDNFNHWDGENNFYPDFDESCVGLIFISDSSNTTLKQNCLIELNMGDVEDGDSIIDTSGNSNIGLLIGDYTIKKESTLVPLVRDSEMKLPETENDNRAI